ncbi:MAG: diacylglycerol/polyprenol kinase family protein [Alphaproteobacteria bacterium]
MFALIRKIWDYTFGKHSILSKLGLGESVRNEFYRKSIHLGSLWFVVFIYFVPTTISFYSFLILLILDFILEYGSYKKWPLIRATYSRLFYKAFRSKETKKNKFEPSGSVYLLLAATICSFFFVKEVTIVALSVMIIADANAALFGKVYGMRKLRARKTTEGTFAFVVSALLVMLVLNPLLAVTYRSIIACFVAVLFEVYSDKLKIDDNLSIPLVVGAVLTFL